jgi:1,4-dihydroxy-2-naphthoate octaprenyltransferase
MARWLLAARPKTLSVAVVPVLVGSALAAAQGGGLSWSVLLAALAAAVLIQAGTNLYNDAGDFERGADDHATRLGPLRVTAAGLLAAAAVRRGAYAAFAAAFALGLYLVAVGGWPILALGLAAIAAGLAYTGGPRPIAYGALGELFVLAFFGLAAVVGTYYLHAGGVTAAAWAAGLVVGLPAAAVLVVNNYRDLENDRRAGKHTLAVRIGRPASRWEYAALMLGPFVLLPLLGLPLPYILLPYLALPAAVALIRRLAREPIGPGLNRLLAATALWQLLLGALLCAALIAARLWRA